MQKEKGSCSIMEETADKFGEENQAVLLCKRISTGEFLNEGDAS